MPLPSLPRVKMPLPSLRVTVVGILVLGSLLTLVALKSSMFLSEASEVEVEVHEEGEKTVDVAGGRVSSAQETDVAEEGAWLEGALPPGETGSARRLEENSVAPSLVTKLMGTWNLIGDGIRVGLQAAAAFCARLLRWTRHVRDMVVTSLHSREVAWEKLAASGCDPDGDDAQFANFAADVENLKAEQKQEKEKGGFKDGVQDGVSLVRIATSLGDYDFSAAFREMACYSQEAKGEIEAKMASVGEALGVARLAKIVYWASLVAFSLTIFRFLYESPAAVAPAAAAAGEGEKGKRTKVMGRKEETSSEEGKKKRRVFGAARHPVRRGGAGRGQDGRGESRRGPDGRGEARRSQGGQGEVGCELRGQGEERGQGGERRQGGEKGQGGRGTDEDSRRSFEGEGEPTSSAAKWQVAPQSGDASTAKPPITRDGLKLLHEDATTSKPLLGDASSVKAEARGTSTYTPPEDCFYCHNNMGPGNAGDVDADTKQTKGQRGGPTLRLLTEEERKTFQESMTETPRKKLFVFVPTSTEAS